MHNSKRHRRTYRRTYRRIYRSTCSSRTHYLLTGHSLLELVITLSLTVTLIAVAAPSFANLINKNEVAAQASALHESLYFARNAAITRQQLVQICQVGKESTSCSSDYSSNRSWSKGWIVFADTNQNNQLDEADDVLRYASFETNNGIVFNQRGRLRFFPDGSARSAGFYVCDNLGQYFKHVYLLYSGRARITSKLSDKHREKCKASLS